MVEFVAEASFPQLAVAATAFLLGLNVVFSAAGFALERSPYGRARRIWAIALPEGQIRREIWASVRMDGIAGTGLAALVSLGAISPSFSGAGSAALTFAVSWLAFDTYYWFLHRAMHTRPLYRFHRFHHDSKVTTAFTGNSMSSIEALGWTLGFALGPLLLALFAPVSLTGWALYLVYNYSGNLVGHVNAEFLPRATAGRLVSWAMHPIVYHALHHARFNNHYGFGSGYMDRLMRTEWSDWPALYERVRAGQALARFSERG